jgi:hypothetical protein
MSKEITATKSLQEMLPANVLEKFQEKMVQRANKLAVGVVQNYPESNHEWVRCTDWGKEADGTYYKVMKFLVESPINEGQFEERVVDVEKDLAPAALSLWLQYEAGMVNPFYGYKPRSFWEEADWDAPALDVLMQVHFYGEVVFG